MVGFTSYKRGIASVIMVNSILDEKGSSCSVMPPKRDQRKAKWEKATKNWDVLVAKYADVEVKAIIFYK